MHRNTLNCAKELDITLPIKSNDNVTRNKCLEGCVAKRMNVIDLDGRIDLNKFKSIIPFSDQFLSDCFDIKEVDNCSTIRGIVNCIRNTVKIINNKRN